MNIAELSQRLDMYAEEAVEVLRSLGFTIEGVHTQITDAQVDILIEADEGAAPYEGLIEKVRQKLASENALSRQPDPILEPAATPVAAVLPDEVHIPKSCAAPGVRHIQRRVALLVGVEQYRDERIAPLKFATADVLALEKRLRGQCRFDEVVTLAQEPGYDRPDSFNIEKAIEEIAGDLRPDDLFFFYFSGHGIERDSLKGQDRRSYLLTEETSWTRPELRSLSRDILSDILSGVEARYRVLLFDACRNSPEQGKGDGGNTMAEAVSRDLTAMARGSVQTGVTTAFYSACGRGKRAYEWPKWGQGVFTHFLLEGLDGAAWRNDELEFRSLVDHTSRNVRDWTRRMPGFREPQEPWYEEFGAGERIVLGLREEAAADFTDRAIIGVAPEGSGGFTATLSASSATNSSPPEPESHFTPPDIQILHPLYSSLQATLLLHIISASLYYPFWLYSVHYRGSLWLGHTTPRAKRVAVESVVLLYALTMGLLLFLCLLAFLSYKGSFYYNTTRSGSVALVCDWANVRNEWTFLYLAGIILNIPIVFLTGSRLLDFIRQISAKSDRNPTIAKSFACHLIATCIGVLACLSIFFAPMCYLGWHLVAQYQLNNVLKRDNTIKAKLYREPV